MQQQVVTAGEGASTSRPQVRACSSAASPTQLPVLCVGGPAILLVTTMPASIARTPQALLQGPPLVAGTCTAAARLYTTTKSLKDGS